MSAAVARMGKGQSDPFAEHAALMKEVYHEYQKREDFDNMALVETLLRETSRVASSKEATVQQLITGGCMAVFHANELCTVHGFFVHERGRFSVHTHTHTHGRQRRPWHMQRCACSCKSGSQAPERQTHGARLL